MYNERKKNEERKRRKKNSKNNMINGNNGNRNVVPNPVCSHQLQHLHLSKIKINKVKDVFSKYKKKKK
jgi:hypothetical protein